VRKGKQGRVQAVQGSGYEVMVAQGCEQVTWYGRQMEQLRQRASDAHSSKPTTAEMSFLQYNWHTLRQPRF
jgi:hypothetical protein